ncbi:hypothetical protein, partial [Bradyrhizobium jicamae]|uniref:hypothetical protein n=1 Tax=Bradyrhizobium jicamae TaxID=280332 RepID=UPI001BABFED3
GATGCLGLLITCSWLKSADPSAISYEISTLGIIFLGGVLLLEYAARDPIFLAACQLVGTIIGLFLGREEVSG